MNSYELIQNVKRIYLNFKTPPDIVHIVEENFITK